VLVFLLTEIAHPSVLFLISTFDSFRLLRMSKRAAKNDVEKEYKYGQL
jgi:hypothetical protein